MTRFSAWTLLAVFGIGVFLAGLELMITAVALPAIIVDLADWTHLREASWIVADYLDVVLHIFTPEARSYYRLEELWGDAPPVEVAAG